VLQSLCLTTTASRNLSNVISEVTFTGPRRTWLWIPILLEQLCEYTIYLGTVYYWWREGGYLYM